jgi:hypothetical protein
MLTEVHTENANFNLATIKTVLTSTPDALFPMECRGHIVLGDGVDDLDGSGGNFEFTISVGGKIIQPDPQIIAFSSADESAVFTGEEVLLRVKSPNAGDTDVDVTATLYDVSDTWINKNKRGLIKDGLTWYQVIYKPIGSTEILRKAVKDKDGNDITDLEAGRIATEERATI